MDHKAASMDVSMLYMWITVITVCVTHTGANIENLAEFWYEDELDCPSAEENWLEQKWIPWGVPNRARLTLPPGVLLDQSTIPGAGLGVFATTFIPRYTWLGEYEGEVVKKEKDISDYAWTVWRDGEIYSFVDAHDESTSSWIRWINCSRHVKEENVKFYECRGKIFYVTFKDIFPGQELFVYYGDEYAEDQLQIDINNYHNEDIDIELYKRYPCWNITQT